jgi:hypothetical protein
MNIPPTMTYSLHQGTQLKLCQKNYLTLSVRKLIENNLDSFGLLYLRILNEFPEEAHRLLNIPVDHWALLRVSWEEKLMVAWKTVLELQVLNVLATNSMRVNSHRDQELGLSQEQVQETLDHILAGLGIRPETALLAHLRQIRPEWRYWAPEKLVADLPRIIREHLRADRPAGVVETSDSQCQLVPTSLAGTITTNCLPNYVHSPSDNR